MAARRPSGGFLLNRFQVGYILSLSALLFLAQHLSLASVVTKRLALMSGCRLVLNVLAITAVTVLLPRRARAGVALVAGCIGVASVAYAQTFHQPLSVYPLLFSTTMKAQVLWAMLTTALGWWTPALLALSVLAASLSVWEWRRGGAVVPPGRRLAATGAAVVLYALVFAAGWVGFSLGLDSSHSFDWHVSRRAAVIGLSPTWCLQITQQVRLSADPVHYIPCEPDRIPGGAAVTNAVAGRHLIFVQAESLDWNALSHTVGGQPLMPFLSRMAREGECRKIEAFSKAGSVGMDFGWATGCRPDGPLRPKDLRDVPLTNGIPWRLAARGYTSVVLHGNTGEFYGRRFLWRRLPGAKAIFAEELKGAARERSYWGFKDYEVLRESGRLLAGASGPQCHLIVTLDSHGPYDLIDHARAEPFPGARGLDERYLNSMRALDRELETYFGSLRVPYAAAIYGDHAARGSFRTFVPAREGAAEYVPLVMWRAN